MTQPTQRYARFSYQGLSELIAKCYEAACEPEQWADFLSSYACAMGASSGGFQFRSRANTHLDLFVTIGFSDELIQEFCEYYYLHDIWYPPAEKLPAGTILTNVKLIEYDEPISSKYYNEYLRRLDAFHLNSICIANDPYRSGYLTVLRRRKDSDFTDEEQSFSRALSPHLRRACSIQRRLSQVHLNQKAWRQAIDRLPYGMLLVDGEARIVERNRAADEILRAGDGLIGAGDRLTVARPAEANALATLIRSATGWKPQDGTRKGGALPISRNGDRSPYTLLVCPLPLDHTLSFAEPEPLALVIITDPDRRATALGRNLIAVYGLTPAEAVLVNTLIVGRSLADYSAEARIAKETARWRLKQVFAKTGTHTQHELTALVLNSFTPFGF